MLPWVGPARADRPANKLPPRARCRRGVTLEYQRQQAKAMQQYFKAKKLQKTVEQGS